MSNNQLKLLVNEIFQHYHLDLNKPLKFDVKGVLSLDKAKKLITFENYYKYSIDRGKLRANKEWYNSVDNMFKCTVIKNNLIFLPKRWIQLDLTLLEDLHNLNVDIEFKRAEWERTSSTIFFNKKQELEKEFNELIENKKTLLKKIFSKLKTSFNLNFNLYHFKYLDNKYFTNVSYYTEKFWLDYFYTFIEDFLYMYVNAGANYRKSTIEMFKNWNKIVKNELYFTKEQRK